MRKLILLFALLPGVIISDAQQNYRCEFADTIKSVFPDSLFRYLALKNNFSDAAIEKILEQHRTNPPSFRYYRKIVRAGKDQTIITIDKGSLEGNLTINTFDSLLYKNDEIYTHASTANGFSDKPFSHAKKSYRGTGKKLMILDYRCDEYISTDSTSYIWVTRIAGIYQSW